MDILLTLAAVAGLSDNNKFKEHVDSLVKYLTDITALIDPFVSLRETDASAEVHMTEAQRDMAKEKYIEMLTNGGGFTSLGQIQTAVSGLNTAIKELADDDHPTAATAHYK